MTDQIRGLEIVVPLALALEELDLRIEEERVHAYAVLPMMF